MKKLFLLLSLTFILLFGLSLGQTALASSAVPPTGGGGGETVDITPGDLSPAGDTDVPTLIGTLIKGALGIVGSIALLMFVYGGFMLLVSQGDSGKITKGKGIMIWAAVGLIVIFGSYIFVSFILTELTQSGGGEQACGQGALEGYSCMNKSLGTDCVTNLCPGGADNQCCKAKPTP